MRRGTARRPSPTGRRSLLRRVAVDADVLRLPANGDDVDLAVAVEVGTGRVLDGHAAVLDDLPLPLLALLVEGLVDAHPAALAAGLRFIVAHTNHQFVA